VHRLLADLVVNDDGIYEQQPAFCREHFCSSPGFVAALVAELTASDVRDMRQQRIRDPLLQTVFRLHQSKPEAVGAALVPALQQLMAAM